MPQLKPVVKPADLRPVYRLRVRPLPDVETIRALRELLKRMQRQFGFQCLECVEEAGEPALRGLLKDERRIEFEQDER